MIEFFYKKSKKLWLALYEDKLLTYWATFYGHTPRLNKQPLNSMRAFLKLHHLVVVSFKSEIYESKMEDDFFLYIYTLNKIKRQRVLEAVYTNN